MNHRRLPRGIILALGLAIPSIAAAQPPAFGSGPSSLASPTWRFRPGFTVGYDSFGQRYVLGERDTLDLIDEASARLTTALQYDGRTGVALKNTFGMGQQTTRDDFLAEIYTSRRGIDLRFDQELHYRSYRPGSDFVLSSGWLSGLSRCTARLPLGEGWRLRLEDRFEWTTYDSTSRYSYNERRNDIGAEIERSYGLFSHLDLGYAYGMRSVPDSSGIDSWRHVATLGWQHDLGRHDLIVEQRLERRRYRDPRLRSAFLDWSGDVAAVVGLHARMRLRPEYRTAVLWFDRPDSVYADYNEQSVELLVEGDASDRTILALGPRGEFRRGSSDFDRPYDQWSLKGSVSYMLGTTFWLQFTDEIGSRQHLAGDDFLFTDYYFNWSTLYLTWRPVSQLGLELFFALDPEVHEENADTSTLLLVSAAATWGLR